MRILQEIVDKYQIFKAFITDYKTYSKAHSSIFTKQNLERNMLLLSHALEKGMTFQNKKRNWGGQKCIALCKNIERYVELYNETSFALRLSVNVLHKYNQDPYSDKSIATVSKIEAIVKKNKSLINESEYGLKEITEQTKIDDAYIRDFFFSRNSVRVFSDLDITAEEIKNALSFACCTPTACNRQSSRVYAFKNKSKISEILDNQLGDQGWCKNANTLFVITGVTTYFGGVYERKQVYIDGGLYAMNFVYGLHIQNIASCYKMFVREPKTTMKFRQICSIPDNEEPIVLVLAGHYSDTISYSPYSHRDKPVCIIDGSIIDE